MTLWGDNFMAMEKFNCVLPGYQLLEQVYRGQKTIVYRAAVTTALVEDSTKFVIIKLLTSDYPTYQELLQFRHQYTITKNLNLSGVIRPYRLEEYHRGYALVMEDYGGISLDQYQAKYQLSLVDILKVACQIAEVFHQLYQQRIIHKDIKPANILIHPTTQKVKLIDFGIASLLPHETQEILSPNLLEGTLAYLSPEQTGRMNRGIDYRTDFYALGVTLYELLTGQLPFMTNDAMALIHCHLAQVAQPVHQINPQIPLMVSQLVAKLMAKNVEDRYQSALGLKYDLEQCLNQLVRMNGIGVFELGQRDLSDRFLIPEKLYGREEEVSTLLAAFDRVAGLSEKPVSHHSTELLLVTGFSGVGKTAIVNEVHKPIVQQKGYFIKGKFDQFNRNIPLFAFVQALRDLMCQLLSESDVQLADWKAYILSAVGESGRVLIEVIPELERIIGFQPPVAELSGTAAQNRFNLLLRKLIQVFTTIEHPLVVFIDDLQWADIASLQLLKLLIQDGGHLLILGAYRDNEVWASHPLLLTIDDLLQKGLKVTTIAIQPLGRSDINQLVADTLSCDYQLAQPLTDLVYQKTQGNPFFTTQFLNGLHQDGFIVFDRVACHWLCDLSKIELQSLTNDVITFMAQQLQKLEPATQLVLRLAACIGAQFDLQTLAIVSEQSMEDVSTALWLAMESGLVIPLDQLYKFYPTKIEVSQEPVTTLKMFAGSGACTYRFLHDRVQEAAYSLISPTETSAVHLHIGQLLLARTPEKELEFQLFQIVNQLNCGIELIDSPREREDLARLNWRAAVKARMSTAYDGALMYLQWGFQLLSADCWQYQYTLSLAFYQLAAEVAYLSGKYTQMDDFLAIGLQQAKDHLDRAKFYEIQILGLVAQNQPRVAVEYARNILPHFGVQLPYNPSKLSTTLGFFRNYIQMLGKSPKDLLKLPTMNDPNKLAACSLFNVIGAAAQRGMPEMLPFITFAGISLFLQYGNIPRSSMGYTIYAFLLCEKLGQVKEGYALGKAAISLCQQTASREAYAPTLFLWIRFIAYRKESLYSSLPQLLEAYQVSLEIGDTEYAAYSLSSYFIQRYWIGENLIDLQRDVMAHRPAFERLQHLTSSTLHDLLCQNLVNLTTENADACELVGDFFDETAIKSEDLQLQAYTSFRKLQLAILFHRYSLAQEQITIVKKLIDTMDGTFAKTMFYYYDALVRIAHHPHWNRQQQKVNLKRINSILQRLTRLGKMAPANYQCRVWLLAAERFRLLGKSTLAGEYYDRAIATARADSYIQEEAFGNELAARFYLNNGKSTIASAYMQESYYCYAKWGAKSKTDDLERCYPELLAPIFQTQRADLNRLSTLATVTKSLSQKTSSQEYGNLDLVAALQSAHAISSSIELPVLIHQLRQILLQSSGANICIPILRKSFLNGISKNPLENQQVWQVYDVTAKSLSGEASSVEEDAWQLSYYPLEGYHQLPQKLIYQVCHRCETTIFHQGIDDPVLLTDEYFQRYQPQSVMCLPLIYRGELQGIVYLENRFTAGVFTPDRQIVLEFLASQAVATLQNSQLYESVAQRSAAIEASLDGIAILENDRFVYMNPSHAKMFGYEVQELLGQSWQCLYTSEQINHILLTIFPIVISQGQWQGEVIATRLDGSIFDEEISLTLLPNGQLICICRDISDRKKTEISLVKSEAKFRSLVEDGSDLIYAFDLDGIFTYVSPQITKICGDLQPSDLIGKPCIDFIHPEDISLMVDDLQQILQTGLNQNNLEIRISKKEGDWCWIVFNNSPIKNTSGQIIGIQGIGRDITDQKAVYQARQKQEDALKAIVEGTAGKTGEDFYQACTKYLAEIFGVQYACLTKCLDNSFTQAQVMSLWTGVEFTNPFIIDLADTPCLIAYQNSYSIFHDDVQSHFPKFAILADLGAKSYMSVVIRDFSGNILGDLAIIDTKPLPADTSTLQFILQVFANRVAAEMKRQVDEDELRQTNQRLELMNQELLRATRLKDEFLATMSHELRTPLNAILGLSESLQEEILGAINQRQTKAIATIERSGQHLLALINDILEVSKIEAGQLELEITLVSVVDLCTSSIAFVKQQAFKKHIQLNTCFPPDLGSINVDERRMRQVLINLLNNAVKFTPADGQVSLKVTIEASNIMRLPGISEIDQQEDVVHHSEQLESQSWIVFSIIDTGIGIAPSDQSKLFQPFVQIDSRLNRQYEGTGLGLMLVKQLVELHGGSVTLTSTLGQGSCFSVRLPYLCSIVNKTVPTPFLGIDQNNTPIAVTESISSTEKPLILLAEDNPDNIDTISAYLEVQDYRLIIARNGKEAIDLTRTHTPNLILMDIQMPEMDGLEAIHLIRQDVQSTQIPIIALTALAMTGDREKCLAAGANDYLTKPVKLKQLLITVQQLLAAPTTADLN